MKTFELLPTNGRKSFYGKAIVKETESRIILESYGTLVATFDKSENKFTATNNEGHLSQTTMHHIRSFQTFLGLAPTSKKELLKQYAQRY